MILVLFYINHVQIFVATDDLTDSQIIKFDVVVNMLNGTYDSRMSDTSFYLFFEQEATFCRQVGFFSHHF